MRSHSIVAGYFIILTSLLIPLLPWFYALLPFVFARAFVFSSLIVAYAFACCIHFFGYVLLAEKYQKRLLRAAALGIVWILGLFFVSVLFSSFIDALMDFAYNSQLDILLGAIALCGSVPALVFAVALFRMRDQLGPLAIASMMLPPASVAFMWYGWPVALIAIPSVCLLYREFSR